MMQTLRKKTRLILFIALAGFVLLIFFNWGLDVTGISRTQETNIAEIDGIPVSYNEYLRFVRMKEEENRDISDEEIWNLMIEEIIWNKLIKKEKIMVSDQEVWAIIKSNPPREIYESEYMKNENGEFDFNKYHQLLSSPQSRAWLLEYEYNLKREIPREKIRSLISTFGWVSPFEDSLIIIQQTSTYDITYLNIPLFRARNLVEISEEEMLEYYKNNQGEFTNPASTILKFVFFEKKPSVYDTLEAKERLEDFINRIVEGEDFLEVAREVSDDTSIVTNFEGEIGPKPYLMSVYEKLKDGEISDIIQAAQGFEVIKKVRRGLIYKVKANIEVSPTTKGEIHDKIMSFKEMAQEHGFDSVAVDFNLSVRKTYPMSSKNITFPVRNTDHLTDYLSKAKKGEIAGPFSSTGGYYLFTLDSIIPEIRPEFKDVLPRIKSRMEREKLKLVIAEHLERIYGQLTIGKTMSEAASKDTVVILNQQQNITIGQIRRTLGDEFAGALATLESGQTSSPLITDWAGYIIRCDRKTVSPFDSTMVAPLQMRRQTRLHELSVNIFTPKKVKDKRDLFFE